MSIPNRVVLAGDWHGNTGWAEHVIWETQHLLPDESPRLILHAGDFGFWPGSAGARYLSVVEEALEEVDAELFFVDGNHEWHPRLRDLQLERAAFKAHLGPVRVSPRVSWLPRGYRWIWHGKTWLALGGAVSVDRSVRAEGVNWWPEETFSGDDIATAIEGGPADVMLCHDAPGEVHMDFGTPPHFMDPSDILRSDAHRDQLQTVVDRVQPELLIHGHYHRVVRQETARGRRRILGLDMDGLDGNFTVLDTKTLTEID